MKKILIFTFLLFSYMSAMSQQEFPFDVEILGWLKVHNIGENLELEKVLVIGEDNQIYYKYITGSGGGGIAEEFDPVWLAEKVNYLTITDANSTFLKSYTETDPIWNAEKLDYALQSWVSSQNYLTSYTESDPIWLSDKANYLTIVDANSTFLKTYTETDPIWDAEKSDYALQSWVSSQNYLTSYTESDPLWQSEKALYASISWVSSQNFLNSYTETDPVWTAEKSEYATEEYVNNKIVANTVIFTPDSINTVYSFSVAANDSLIFDSTEVSKAYVFNMSSTAENSGITELILNFDFTFENQAGILKNKITFGSKVGTTQAKIVVKAIDSKIYYIAYADDKLLNFSVHINKKILL